LSQAASPRKKRGPLERENERLSREVERLRQELIERDRKLTEAEKQIADLERQLGLRRQNSTTSSKPPSSDGLAPAERVDEVIDLFPPGCRHCHCRFAGGNGKAATHGEPRRHQVTELPKIEAHITEYRCQSAICPDCGKATQAELPKEVQGHFGPELTGLIAYLTVVCRMPRCVLQELLEQVLHIPLSLPMSIKTVRQKKSWVDFGSGSLPSE
jgi:hypothetical protein